MLIGVEWFNRIIGAVLTICFGYQIVYAILGVFIHQKKMLTKKRYKYAVLISARNEETVIGELIHSLKAQNYPKKCLKIFVCADNCTDQTASIARGAGAIVYERRNHKQIGKGYALGYLLSKIREDYKKECYDGYFVFDADNILDKNFVSKMNAVFANGYRVVTGYRNSKNFGSSWISAGYGVWFLRECKLMNNVRMKLGISAMVSGTGFLISAEIVEKNNGWKHTLLTEDLEFSIDSIISGEKIGYCEKAVFYDEQPTTFETSFFQRIRWVKGAYQVFGRYGQSLFKEIFKRKSLGLFDIFINISPAMLLTVVGILVNLTFCVFAPAILDKPITVMLTALGAIGLQIVAFCLSMLFFSVLTVISEWKNIRATTNQKINSILTFPFYVLTYLPISIAALFMKVDWKPISHTKMEFSGEKVAKVRIFKNKGDEYVG